MTSTAPTSDRIDAPSSNVLIVASVLPANFACLGTEVAALEEAGIDRVQWDIMDGQFVPNLTFGPDVVAAVRQTTTVPFEAHLMILDPDLMLDRWIVDAGCDLVIVHVEACPHLHRTLAAIRERGGRTGVALNPSTPLSAIQHVLDLVDLILVMTVNPGFGGQSYIDTMEPKIAAAAALIEASGFDIELEVDGGIGPDTAATAAAAGARVLVAGSSLYRHPDGLGAAVAELRRCGEEAIT